MQNQGEERWLTYAEAADSLGISTEAVWLRARRSEWPRRAPNEHGAVARVLVSDDDRGTDRSDDRPRPALTAGRPPDDRRTSAGQSDRQPAGHDRPDLPVTGPDIARTVREAVELLLAPLREQLDVANRHLDEERVRADQTERRADEALAEARDVRWQLDETRARALDALTAERIARDEAAGLRAELDARKQFGLWRRVRGR